MSYVIFTDGACSGNPGPGGWGLIIADPSGIVTEKGGSAPETTNNRMELIAVIESLKLLGEPSQDVKIFSDSSYALKGITEWRQGWIKRNWKASTGKPVANVDLWLELGEVLDPLLADGSWGFHWGYVPGHMGVPGNERADAIASSFSNKLPFDLYNGARADYMVDLRQTESSIAKKAKPKNKNKKPHGYVSYVNGRFKFDKTWKTCESRVRGETRGYVLFRKVFSEEEMLEYKAKWTQK